MSNYEVTFKTCAGYTEILLDGSQIGDIYRTQDEDGEYFSGKIRKPFTYDCVDDTLESLRESILERIDEYMVSKPGAATEVETETDSSTLMMAELGSVSSNTMLTDDLIPIFLNALDNLQNPNAAKFRAEWDNNEDDGISEQKEMLLDELFDALDEHAPPYCRFGAHDGDGADYGFWLAYDEDELIQELENNDVIVLYGRDAVLDSPERDNIKVAWIDDGTFTYGEYEQGIYREILSTR